MFEIDLTREDSDYCDDRSASPERQTSRKRRRAASGGADDPESEVPEYKKRYLTRAVDDMSRQIVRRRQQQRPMRDQRAGELSVTSQKDVQAMDRSCSWLGRHLHFTGGDGDGGIWYEGVSLRGVRYRRNGDNALGVVRGFVKKDGNRYAHVQLVTAEGEALAWRATLLLLPLCGDVHLGSISGRFDVSVDGPDEESTPCKASSIKINLVYDANTASWRSPAKPIPRGIKPYCDACISRDSASVSPHARVEGYHTHDFVLVDRDVIGALFRIAQVVDVAPDGLRVRWLGRVCTMLGVPLNRFYDPAELYLTDIHEHVPLDSIRGTCVVHPSASREPQPSGHFYCTMRVPRARSSDESSTFASLVPLQRPLQTCSACYGTAMTEQADLLAFKAMGGLPSVDLYAGGGGTMAGKKGWFRSVLAVDLDTNACDTLEANYPDTRVSCAPVDSLLIAALHLDEAGAFKPVLDGRSTEGSVRYCAPLPQRGSVVLLSASPPCQGHSGLNRHKKADDPLNEEVIKVISEADRLQPDFVLIENVPGMAHARKDGTLNHEAGISYADLSVKMLIGIGYQARIALLDAASYGAASYRKRIFILGARQGVPLPTVPTPSHCNAKFQNPGMSEAARDMFGRAPGAAPFPAWTAAQATEDLPAWEYTGGQHRRGVPAFAPYGPAPPGYALKSVAYRTEPRNAYQRAKRGMAKAVKDHGTGSVSRESHAAIMSARGMVGDGKVWGDGEVVRANPDLPFRTLVTTIVTGAKSQGTVHWDQRRLLTVAERARAQGFPDDYVFTGTINQRNKLIGNAVNVDQANAIFGHIVRTVILPVWREMGKPSDPDVFARAWRARFPITDPSLRRRRPGGSAGAGAGGARRGGGGV